jgi:putative redox protein
MKLEFTRKEKPFVFEVENENGAKCTMDANSTIGGKNAGLRPMELLAASLAGCAAIDILAILKKKRQEPELFAIDIDGKRESELPSAFEWIHLDIRIDEDLNTDALRKIVDLVLAKYCSVAASLNKNIQLNYSINTLTE